ncbi:synaptotagmin-14-like isoform X3 [Rhopilema esculentum]|uniref:synaptotagmin-14-like isoform X3 n=1 Tax=Rhopilema esculentum TaxID=499914 RepID=UPI0031CFCA6C
MPLPWFEPAVIFLGVIGGTALILVLVYFLIKSGKCFCEVNKDGSPDPEYAEVATEDSGTEISDNTCPVNLKEATYVMSTGDLSDKKYISSEDEDNAPGVSQIGPMISSSDTKKQELMPPKQKGSRKKRRSRSMEDPAKGLGNLHITLQYSKKDLFLFAVIHKITDLLPGEVTGIDHVRISMVLLPAKKYRSKTKLVSTSDPEFGASFKFSNVSREDLFKSAMRFRLYGRHVRLGMHFGKEKLLGEVTIHLADVAQRERMSTIRPFKVIRK